MNPIIKSNAIKYGVISGAIGLVYAFVVYAINEDIFLNPLISLLIQLIGFVLFIIAAVQVRKQMGGFITFKEAFSTFVIAAVIGLTIGFVTNVLLFHVVDPQLGPRLQEKILMLMSERLDKAGLDASKQSEILADFETQDTFSLATQFRVTIYGIIIISIIGAIVALVLRRNRDIDWTNQTSDTN